MNAMSLPMRVERAKALLEEVPDEHDLRAGQLANLYEAIEFLERLEDSFRDRQIDD